MLNNGDVLLKVEDLSQDFGAFRAVNHVSFDIKKGEVFGLVGESGCGKTTTGRSIIKLYNISTGNVFFKGVRISAGIRNYQEAIKKAKEDCKAGRINQAEMKRIIDENRKEIAAAHRDQNGSDKAYSRQLQKEVRVKYQQLLAAPGADRSALQTQYKNEMRKAKKTKLVTQIQMIFQDPISALDPRMTVKEIISEGLVIQGERDKKVIDEKVYEMLELVGLVREHASRYPHEFSGGQKQRIGVARSIIMNPELIIADEPVSALDVSVQAQVINLLNELREKFGLTILFIAHDLSVVKYFSDRIGVMYYGNMVELATSDELFAHPLHPYTQALLSAIPLPDPEYEKQRQRIHYDPLKAHDYSVDQPSLREVRPGHFVRCNDAEFAAIQAKLAE